MTKADFIKALKEEAALPSQKQAEAAYESMLALISKTLQKEGELALYGFGSFKVVKRAARAGRNPRTGKALQLPAKKVVKFTPGKALKEQVSS